jgi:hypothetical protein
LQRHLLTEHGAKSEFGAIDASWHSYPRPVPDEGADHLVVTKCFGDGDRVGVEVEQATAARYRRGEVAKIEAEDATDRARFRGQLDDSDAVGEGERSSIRTATDVLETRDCTYLQESQQGCSVERLPAAQAKFDDSGGPEAGTLRAGPHLAWVRGEHVSDRVVELADAVETGGKGRIREGHGG